MSDAVNVTDLLQLGRVNRNGDIFPPPTARVMEGAREVLITQPVQGAVPNMIGRIAYVTPDNEISLEAHGNTMLGRIVRQADRSVAIVYGDPGPDSDVRGIRSNLPPVMDEFEGTPRENPLATMWQEAVRAPSNPFIDPADLAARQERDESDALVVAGYAFAAAGSQRAVRDFRADDRPRSLRVNPTPVKRTPTPPPVTVPVVSRRHVVRK